MSSHFSNFEPVSHATDPTRITRRDAIRLGALSFCALASSNAKADLDRVSPVLQPGGRDIRIIWLHLTGSPSQLDTWDMKPDAPAEFRSPFRPVSTNVPGMEICELFPQMARHAHLYTIVRSMHTSDPSAVSLTRESRSPSSIETAGIDDEEQLRGAYLLKQESERVRERYGEDRFGQSCLIARRLVQRGAHCVQVHMYRPTLALDLSSDGFSKEVSGRVSEEVNWDCHGSAPFPGLDAYRTHCAPSFDRAYTALISDLHARGLYDTTVVIATGDHGRTPRLNRAGGRDHWPHCWSLLIGGGGLRTGQVVGTSDSLAAYPSDRHVILDDIHATIQTLRGLPIISGTKITELL